MTQAPRTPFLTLDLRGHACPLPVLKTRKALQTLPRGTRIRVLASDPAARIDMPHYCAQEGHTLLETREEETGALMFLIERG